MFRSGKNPLKQIVRGLGLRAKYFDPRLECDFPDEEESDAIAEEVISFENNGRDLCVPAVQVQKFERTNREERVVCEGMVVTNKFPNNFVKVVDWEGIERVVVVRSIDFDKKSESVTLFGPAMSSVQDVFLVPCPSRRVGIVRCSKPLHNSLWEFGDVRGKYFPFPLKVNQEDFPRNKPDFDPYDPFEPDQEWIVSIERHTESRV
jgi:hypothetical protein